MTFNPSGGFDRGSRCASWVKHTCHSSPTVSASLSCHQVISLGLFIIIHTRVAQHREHNSAKFLLSLKKKNLFFVFSLLSRSFSPDGDAFILFHNCLLSTALWLWVTKWWGGYCVVQPLLPLLVWKTTCSAVDSRTRLHFRRFSSYTGRNGHLIDPFLIVRLYGFSQNEQFVIRGEHHFHSPPPQPPQTPRCSSTVRFFANLELSRLFRLAGIEETTAVRLTDVRTVAMQLSSPPSRGNATSSPPPLRSPTSVTPVARGEKKNKKQKKQRAQTRGQSSRSPLRLWQMVFIKTERGEGMTEG